MVNAILILFCVIYGTCEAVGSWEPDSQSMVNHCPTLWADNFVESRFPWFVSPDLVLEGQGLQGCHGFRPRDPDEGNAALAVTGAQSVNC